MRRFPSAAHQRVWKDYEKILMLRAITGLTVSVVPEILKGYYFRQEYSESAKEFVDSGQLASNNHLAEQVLPYAKMAYDIYLGILIKILLLL